MRRLNFDDVRALARKDAGAHRTGNALTQVQHGNIFEGLHEGSGCVMVVGKRIDKQVEQRVENCRRSTAAVIR